MSKPRPMETGLLLMECWRCGHDTPHRFVDDYGDVCILCRALVSAVDDDSPLPPSVPCDALGRML